MDNFYPIRIIELVNVEHLAKVENDNEETEITNRITLDYSFRRGEEK